MVQGVCRLDSLQKEIPIFCQYFFTRTAVSAGSESVGTLVGWHRVGEDLAEPRPELAYGFEHAP